MRLPKWIRPNREVEVHLIRFFMYNVVGAMVPLFIAWLVRRIGNIQDPPGAYAPELLFFGVMVSATALGDLTDEKEHSIRPGFQVVKGTLLFSAIVVSAIFGFYEYETVVGPSNMIVRQNIKDLALVLAIALALNSLIAETLVAQGRALKSVASE